MLKNKYSIENIENKIGKYAFIDGDTGDAGASGDTGDAGTSGDAGASGGGDGSSAEKSANSSKSAGQVEGSLFGASDKKADEVVDKDENIDLLAGKYRTQDELVDGYKALTKKLTEDGKIAPESYELSLPEGLGLADAENDVSYKNFNEIAKKHNLSNAAFNDLLALKLQSDIDSQPNFEEELGKLGDGGMELLGGIESFYKSKLSDEEFSALSGFANTAGNIRILDKIRNFGSENLLPNSGGITSSGLATPAQAEEALAVARAAEQKNSPDSGRLRALAQKKFKEAYPD